MNYLAWPLRHNRIRRDLKNHTFGMVREGGTRAHQGWDLVAAPMTPCYAVADGTVVFADPRGLLGNMTLLEFKHRGRKLYAAYCHLGRMIVRRHERVGQGTMIGYTGNTGNAESMRGDDQHLHFEIRTFDFPGQGLDGRLDPTHVYGPAPIGWAFYEGHGRKIATRGTGLKVAGINVRGGTR